MEADVVETVLIIGFHPNADLFDGTGTVVAAWPGNPYLRGIWLAGFDEEVVGEPDVLPLIERSHVVDSIFFNADGAPVNVTLAAGERNLLLIIEHENSVADRPIREDCKFGLRAFDSAEVAAVFLGGTWQSCPAGKVVGHVNLFDQGQVNYADIEVPRM